MLHYIRFDIIFGLIALGILVTTMLRSPKKQFRNLICLIIVFGGFGFLYFYNIFSLTTNLNSLLESLGVFSFVDQYLSFFVSVEGYSLLMFIFYIVLSSFGYFILVGIVKLFSFSHMKKMQKENYALRFNPFLGFFLGVFKAAISIYLLYLFFSLSSDVFQFKFSEEIIIDFIKSYDPLLDAFKSTISKLVFPF